MITCCTPKKKPTAHDICRRKAARLIAHFNLDGRMMDAESVLKVVRDRWESLVEAEIEAEGS